uniref:Putative argonaute n=1 Tax=Cupiennius salei TaxID=6928 RepID=A0A061QLL7_CUPSA
MLPRRGRGRGTVLPPSSGVGRGRGRGQSSSRRQQFEDPEVGAGQPQTSQSHSQRTWPQRPPIEEHETSAQHTYHEVAKTRGKTSERNVNPEELGLQFKRKVAVSPAGLPTRPGEGTLGKRIRLLSNCFPIKFPSGNVYHYDVSIVQKRRNPENEDENTTNRAARDHKYRCLSTKQNRHVVELMLSTNPIFDGSYAAYDGKKNLYTRDLLRAHFPVKCEVVLPDEDAENPGGPQANLRQTAFEVEIKPVNKTETNSCAVSLDSLHSLYEKRAHSVPQETIMALETILRHGPCLRFTPIGRSFFFPPGPQDLHPLGGGLEIWFGFHQSIRLGQWDPVVNIDTSATTFYQKRPVLEFMAECLNKTVGDLRRRVLSNIDIRVINNKLKNLRIEVNHLGTYRRKYRIFKLLKDNAHRLKFDMEDNGRTVTTTVATYFRERYRRNLDFPNLPCLQVHPENKKRYLPVEVCDILAGQHCKKNLDARQKAEMIKFTSAPPKERFAKIRGIATQEDMNSDRLVRGFGMEVSRVPLSLEGRVLDSPSLVYKDDARVTPKDGSWNMRQRKFLRGAHIESWVLLSFANISRRDLQRFSELLVTTGRDMDISINDPQFVDIIDPTRCDVRRELSEMKTKYNATLAVIVVPASEKLLYGKIKKAAETTVGLVTQCIKEGNVVNPKKCTPQLVGNLCLKINSKMGGENHSLFRGEILPIMCKPVIVIGADVNHPGPSRGIKPSLAACVGSLDSRFSRYAVSIRAQQNVDENRKSLEIIVDLKAMVLELMKTFYQHTRGKKPEKIIFFRDGVSEGQFEQVRNREVSAVRSACRTLQKDYEPGITFLVVQKRHHVRFMPENPREGVGAMQNVPPGTTVDTAVTHPVNFDYYLCSHYGLKGTSRPSHYTVLEDDNEFGADEIQKLTYQLCHTYARCTRSISLPVPVAYADLAASRARVHLESAMEESTSSSDTSDGDGAQILPESVIDAIRVDPLLIKSMYFV